MHNGITVPCDSLVPSRKELEKRRKVNYVLVFPNGTRDDGYSGAERQVGDMYYANYYSRPEKALVKYVVACVTQQGREQVYHLKWYEANNVPVRFRRS